MLEWSRLGPRIGVVSAAAAALGATVWIAAALGHDNHHQPPPTITGDPIVGHVLTANLPGKDDPVPTSDDPSRHHDSDSGDDEQPQFKWQSCDPVAADCTGSDDSDDEDHDGDRSSRHHSDYESPWTDLTELSPTGTSYTVQQSDLGDLIRVVVRTEGWHWHHHWVHWSASDPVGPVTEEVKVVPPPPPPPPEPEHGISFLVQPAGGTVTIKEPGETSFTPLSDLEKIPVNSVIDTRGGTVKLTAATGDLGDTTEDNSVNFWDGLIRIEQSGDTNAAATAKLVQKLRCSKSRSARTRVTKSSGPLAAASRKSRRRVWGSGHGNYKTSGGGGTGSVRGTTWLTKDTCRGTFFKVTDGIGITVFDFDLGESFDLGPGQSYFARNR
jgi:hypothetical protein